MIITVNKNDFLSKLIAVSKVAKDNKIRPVLSGVKLEATDKITMTATDLELTISTQTEGEIQVKGTAVFNPSKVIEYVNTLEENEINIELDKNILKIFEAEFEVYNADDYPMIKMPEPENKIKINSSDFQKSLMGCIAVSKTVTDNVALSGVRVEISNKIRCIASDSFRMAYFECISDCDANIKTTIPNNAVFRLIDLLKNSITLELYQDKSNIIFEIDDYKIITRTIDVAFPNWESLSKSIVTDKKVTVNKADAVKILKRITIFSRDNLSAKNAATFELDKNLINVKAIGGSAKAKDKIPAIVEGDKLKMNLNSQFIIDYLGTIDSEAVELRMSGSANPVMIQPCNSNNTWFLCMPLALNEV